MSDLYNVRPETGQLSLSATFSIWLVISDYIVGSGVLAYLSIAICKVSGVFKPMY